MVCQVNGSNDPIAVLRRPLATSLLESRLPARLAWVSPSGAPRVSPLWHHWTGTVLEMATFPGSTKVSELADGDSVVVSIDTDAFPYRRLALGGPISLAPASGLAACYRSAAVRHLGPSMATAWLRELDERDQVVITLTPRWARASDLGQSDLYRRVLTGTSP
jgi:hypothetical protein